MKKILGTAFSLTGAVIGAGMMTGAEIYQYFGGGFGAVVSIILSCILMGCLFYTIAAFCADSNITNIYDMGNVLFGKYKTVFLFFISAQIVVCAGAMLAGTGQLFYQLMKISPYLVSCVIAILGSICAFNGIKWVKKVNYFAVPFIIAFVIALIFIKEGGVIAAKPKPMYGSVVFSLYNVSLALPLCCSGDKICKRHMRLACAIFVTLSCVIMTSISLLISTEDKNANIPLFNSIMNISAFLASIYSIVLFFASGTTYISSMVAYSKNKSGIIYATFCSVVISMLEIKNIVKYIYPITGFLCIICLIRIFMIKVKL